MNDSPRLRVAAQLWTLVVTFCFLVLTGLVAAEAQGVLDLDAEVGGLESLARDHGWILDVADVFSIATHPTVILVLVAGVAAALWFKGYQRPAVWALVVVVTARAASIAIKVALGRERPIWDDPVATVDGAAYPSGHVTAIAAASGITIVLTSMMIRRRGLRRLIWAGVVALALLVGFDRLVLGVHHFSDVLGGYLLGAAVTLVVLLVLDPRPTSIGLLNAPLPDAIPSGDRKVAAILNPIKVDDPVAFKAMVETLAVESGWREVAWWETTVEDTGYRMAHEAAVSGVDLVLAIGGDGTIRAVCEELAGTGIPVGIVPAGTGNLLARNLSIPLYLRAAVDVGLNGQDRAIDMVRVSGDDMDEATFLVMAGMGFDAAIMEGVNEDFKKKVGWLAYVWSALKALMFPAIKVEVSVDGGEPSTHRARTVVIGNVGYLQAGMPLIPDAAIDDGELDVVLLYPRRFLSWLPVAARVLTKNKRTDDSIARMRGRSVVVRAGTAAPRQLDGDLVQPGRELRAECLHGRLLVRVPR